MRKIKFVCITMLILCGFILAKKEDDRVMSLLLNEVQNEDKSIIQWEDKEFGELIGKAFGKDKVTYMSTSYVSYTKPIFEVIKIPKILEKSSFFACVESKCVI